MRGALASITTFALMAAGLVGGPMMMRHGMAAPALPQASAFDAGMAEAMERMHAGMTAPGSGDPDRDFATMMIPHHQGAIDMARLELLHGHDPVLRRLAQGIVVEQGQEIAVMRRALTDLPAPSPPAAGPAHHHHAITGTTITGTETRR